MSNFSPREVTTIVRGMKNCHIFQAHGNHQRLDNLMKNRYITLKLQRVFDGFDHDRMDITS